MKSRALNERAQRIIDKLSDRIDKQAMRPGADAPHVVAIVGAFHSYAGRLERRIEGYGRRLPFLTASDCAAELRILRRCVIQHALIVAMRGAYTHRQLAGERAHRQAKSDDPGR